MDEHLIALGRQLQRHISHISPFFADRASLVRIIEAANIAPARSKEDSEDLRRTLDRLTDWIVMRAAEGPRPAPEDVQAYLRSVERVFSLSLGDDFLAHPPPKPPKQWLRDVQTWAEAEQSFGTRVPSSQEVTRFAYPRLLEFYELAFRRAPVATSNGPTHRFVKSYLTELGAAIDQRGIESLPREVVQRARANLALPPDATLCKRIDTNRLVGTNQEVEALLAYERHSNNRPPWKTAP